ncbi:MAG: hypothetical protein Q9160_009097 [Pyrenula sp. 1 TL-2023]
MATSSPASSSFQGKVIALTGGASGIGWATVQLLYDRGAKISIADIDQDALDAATAYLNHGELVNSNERVLLKRVDVTIAREVDEWIAETVTKLGRLDGAANVAGVIGQHHGLREVAELDDEEWEKILRVNLTGMMYSARAELREMVRLGEETGREKEEGKEGSVQEGKSIVCVSSIQGQMGFAKHAAYAASKHGVEGLAKSAAKEYGDRNIRVNTVAPGIIDTPLVQKRNAFIGPGPPPIETPIKRMGTPEEAAQAIIWLLSDQSSFVTGATISVDGGWNC